MVVADINVDNAKETVREIESAGGSAIAVGVDVSDEQQVQAMIAAAVDQYGRLDILFNNVGIPTPRLGLIFEEHTLEDFNRLVAVNLGGVFLGCKHAVLRFKEQGDGGVILNTGIGGGPGGVGRHGLRRHQGRRHPAHPGGRRRSRPLRNPGQRDLPGRDAADRVHGGGRTRRRRGEAGRDRRNGRRTTPARPSDHRRGLRRGRAVPGVGRRRATSPEWRCPSTVGSWPNDDSHSRPRPTAGVVRPPKLVQRIHRRELSRRSVPGVASAPRTGAGATGHPARTDRMHRRRTSSTGCPIPTGRTSRCSTTTPA